MADLPLLHYGYGWELNSLRGHRVVEYDGNWQGFQSAMARYDDRDLTVIALTNLSLCRVQRIVHTVAGYFDPEVAHFGAAAEDPHPILTREFAAFIGEAQHGGPVSLRLTAAGQRELSPVWMGALARDLQATGPIIGISLAEERRVRRHARARLSRRNQGHGGLLHCGLRRERCGRQRRSLSRILKADVSRGLK